jgi:hypothetical protein
MIPAAQLSSASAETAPTLVEAAARRPRAGRPPQTRFRLPEVAQPTPKRDIGAEPLKRETRGEAAPPLPDLLLLALQPAPPVEPAIAAPRGPPAAGGAIAPPPSEPDLNPAPVPSTEPQSAQALAQVRATPPVDRHVSPSTEPHSPSRGQSGAPKPAPVSPQPDSAAPVLQAAPAAQRAPPPIHQPALQAALQSASPAAPEGRESQGGGSGRPGEKSSRNAVSQHQMAPFRLDGAQVPGSASASGESGHPAPADLHAPTPAAPLQAPADVRIARGHADALAVTIAAGSPDLRDRLTAARDELRADLARIGTEVEAIHVELRGDSGAQSETPQGSAGPGADAGQLAGGETARAQAEFRPEPLPEDPSEAGFPRDVGSEGKQTGDAPMNGRSSASGEQPGRQLPPSNPSGETPPRDSGGEAPPQGLSPATERTARIDRYA